MEVFRITDVYLECEKCEMDIPYKFTCNSYEHTMCIDCCDQEDHK